MYPTLMAPVEILIYKVMSNTSPPSSYETQRLWASSVNFQVTSDKNSLITSICMLEIDWLAGVGVSGRSTDADSYGSRI